MKELRNSNARYRVRLRDGKIIGGESKHNHIYIRVGKILDQAIPTSLSDLCSLGKGALRVGVLAALLFGAGVVGFHLKGDYKGNYKDANSPKQRPYHPKIVEVLDRFAFVDGGYSFVFDPNLSISRDANSWHMKVYTTEDFDPNLLLRTWMGR